MNAPLTNPATSLTLSFLQKRHRPGSLLRTPREDFISLMRAAGGRSGWWFPDFQGTVNVQGQISVSECPGRGEGTLPWIRGLRTRPDLQTGAPNNHTPPKRTPPCRTQPPSLRMPSGSPGLRSLLPSRDHDACSLHPSTVGRAPRAPPFPHWAAPSANSTKQMTQRLCEE